MKHPNSSSSKADHLVVVIAVILVCGLVAAGTAIFTKRNNNTDLNIESNYIATLNLPETKELMPQVSIKERIDSIKSSVTHFSEAQLDHAQDWSRNIGADARDFTTDVKTNFSEGFETAGFVISVSITQAKQHIAEIDFTPDLNIDFDIKKYAQAGWDKFASVIQHIDDSLVSVKNTLQQPETQTIVIAGNDDVSTFNNIEPTSGNPIEMNAEPAEEGLKYSYEVDVNEMGTEGVLVPKEKTVISSSRDGKIAYIYVDNGDTFSKGDILLEYACVDAKSEKEIAIVEENLRKQELDTTVRLLKLDLISGLEEKKAIIENKKAEARTSLYSSKVDDCIIRAAYNGRVIKRLANPHEYTRTDRVLMEVASDDDLDIEFLIPSKWLRWINIDAPFTVTVNETDEQYEAQIVRIYGEVDPVSQSIQVRGTLKPYKQRLLPGMSGNVHLDINTMRDAGVTGYLEQPRQK
jgi:RND family efflux transporter MFP subunit